jgi:hypothetical protein
MPVKSTIAAIAVLAGAFALVACGSTPKRDQSAAGKKQANEVESIQEIDIIRKDLLRVSNAVRNDQRKEALNIASETYVQHFEKIEPVLTKVSPSLKQSLETQFSGTLRKKIRSNAPKAEIFGFITRLDARIGQAQVQIKNLH